MDPVIGGILLDVATKVGAPIIKGVLARYVGGTAASIGGEVIDLIAGKAGVEPAQLPDLPPDKIEAAVVDAEREASDLLVQWNVQQGQAIDLMKAEMDKGGATWTWAWRPAGMWLFLGLVVWYVAVVPLINLFLGLMGASIGVTLIVDVSVFVTLFVTYTGLYMGGHTVKDAMAKFAGKP